jgi:hypothetical protein
MKERIMVGGGLKNRRQPWDDYFLELADAASQGATCELRVACLNPDSHEFMPQNTPVKNLLRLIKVQQ